MRFLLFILFAFLQVTVWAQQPNVHDNYKPLACDSGVLGQYVSLTEARYFNDLAIVKKKPKLYRAELMDMYKDRYESLLDRYNDNHFYTDTFVNNYFQRILSVVLKANPQLPQDVRLVVARYPWPNAACHGEGTIMFNLELVRWLENESQIAFVLCHEMAHYYEDHVNRGMEDYAASITDPELAKKLRQIYYSQYNTYEQVMALVKNFAYSDRKHSRLFESEADSIAILLLRNTPYSELEAIGALKQLDRVDDEIFDTLNWKTALHVNGSPFRDEWLQEEGGLANFGKGNRKDIGELDSDSMKTHPDCGVRIGLLQGMVQTGPHKKISIQSEETFKTIQTYAEFERVRNTCFFGNYGRALFYAMDLLQQYPDNAYLLGIIGRSWLVIYWGQEKHVLGKYVALPGATDVYSYNQLLIVINNLRLSEISRLGFHFLNRHSGKAEKDEDLLYSLMQFSKIEGKTELYVSLKNQYKKNYPEGMYISQL